MKLTYIAVATLYSSYFCFVLLHAPNLHAPNLSAPNLHAPNKDRFEFAVVATQAFAVVCLLSCAVAVQRPKAALSLGTLAFFVYLSLAVFDSWAVHSSFGNIYTGGLKGGGGILVCLAVAFREAKEDHDRDREVF